MLVGCRQALFLGGAPGAAVGRVHLPLLGPVPSKRPPNVSSVTPPARGGPVTASPSARRSRPSRRRASRRAGARRPRPRPRPSRRAVASCCRSRVVLAPETPGSQGRSHDKIRNRRLVRPLDEPAHPAGADPKFTRVNSCFPGEAMFAIKVSPREARARSAVERVTGPSRSIPRTRTRSSPGCTVLPRGSNVRDKGVAKRGPRAFICRARDRPEPAHPAGADPKFTRVNTRFPGEAMFAIKVSPREARARSSVERVTGPSRPVPGRGHAAHQGVP